jgi:pyrophosphate--fructose-6-phosphate 1-phosphotransferase
MIKSPLQIAREGYVPKMPKSLQGSVKIVEGEKTESVADQERIKEMFPNTYGMPILTLEPGEASGVSKAINVGVILSGGQAPGGHNVIYGLFEGLKKLNPENKLYGFLGGPGGLVDNNYGEITVDMIAHYRNTVISP